MSSLVPSVPETAARRAVAARRPPPHRRSRGRDRARPVALPRPHRRPPDRPAARRPPVRHAREPRPPAGRGRRAVRADRRLPDDHGPRRRAAACPTTSRARSPTTSPPGSTRRARRSSPTAQVEALNQLLLPFLSLVSVAEVARNPTVKAEVAAVRRHGDERADVRLSGPPGGRHPVLPREPRPGRPRPAAAPRAHADDRPPLQRALRARRAVFPEPEALLAARRCCSASTGARWARARGNAIALRATADETARLIRRARTDAERRITYEPERRPEVSNLVLLAALCRGEAPEAVADEVGDRGASALKALVTEAVNERLAPVRARRAELAARPRRTCATCCARATSGRGRSRPTRSRRCGGSMHTDY